MNEVLFRQLLMENEGTRLDFKRQQYSFVGADDRTKSELLKDLLAFANAWRSEPAYVVIGVGEGAAGERDLVGVGPADQIDDASLQQFVGAKLNKALTFSYRPFAYDGMTFGVFEVPVQERPFFAKRDFGIVKKEFVYYRLGSSCAEATPAQVAQMGRDDGARAATSPVLDVQFADLETGELMGKELVLHTTRHKWHDPKGIPDHVDPPPPPGPELFPGLRLNLPALSRPLTGRSAREEFWRELAGFVRDTRRFAAIRLAVRNSSPAMASHVRIEVCANAKDMEVLEVQQLQEYPESHFDLFGNAGRYSPQVGPPAVTGEFSVGRSGQTWRIVAERDSLRPREVAAAPFPVYVAFEVDGSFDLQVTCYAAELGEPVVTSLTMRAEVLQLPSLTLDDLERIRYERFEDEARKKGWLGSDDEGATSESPRDGSDSDDACDT